MPADSDCRALREHADDVSMALVQRWRPELWTPTAAQEETALDLSDTLIGSRGRTRLDGCAELWTLVNGEVRCYVIWPDGTSEVVESRPATLRYRRLDLVRAIVGWVAIAAIVWLVVAQAANFHEETLPFAAALIVVSLVGMFVSEIMMNGEINPPGARWQRVGGGD